jgi:hypothetical protein
VDLLLQQIQTHLQITWLYANSLDPHQPSPNLHPDQAAAQLVLPPYAQLQALDQAVRTGDFELAEQEIARIRQLDQQHGPLAELLAQLATQFDIEAICALLASSP